MRSHTSVPRLVAVAGIAAVVVMMNAAPALAHVELSTSDPADGATLTQAPAEITLDFSTASAIAGDGIRLYDENAVPVAIATEQVTETRVRLIPSEPLRDGRWAVTWMMQAPDSHPRSGGFEFTISSIAAIPGDVAVHDPGMPTDMQMEATPSILGLVAPMGSDVGPWLGGLGRMVSILGAMFGIGSLGFAWLVFEGSEAEARVIGFWARRAGAAVVIGVLIEVLGQAVTLANGSLMGALAPPRLLDAVGGAFGVAVGLRLLGGAALFAGTRLETVDREGPLNTLPPDWGSRRTSGQATATTTIVRQRFHVAASPGAMAGALAIAVAFLFDGHTVTAEPSVLVRFAALVHVLAASVWVGGIALLARILIGRYRLGLPLEAARIVVPFSTTAGVAVAVVGLAGIVLALAIAENIGTFFSTPWGRALLAKVTLAGVAGAIGAYNHIVLVPVLKSNRDHTLASESIRTTVRVEVALLVCVAVVTAVFVGLSSV